MTPRLCQRSVCSFVGDTCTCVYACVCTETLKVAACVAPDVLLKAVDQVRLRHRTTTYCDELVSHVYSLPTPQH